MTSHRLSFCNGLIIALLLQGLIHRYGPALFRLANAASLKPDAMASFSDERHSGSEDRTLWRARAANMYCRAGEIAIFANFTKFTGSFPPFFFCLFNLLRMVRLLHMELLRETLPTVSKPTT